MTSKPDVIQISSDSSSLMSSDSGWTNYFPPKSTATSSVKKKGHANKVDSMTNKGSTTQGVSKKATLSHTAAIPPQSLTGKRVQVLGLANGKTWEAIKAKQFGVKKPPIGTGPSAATKGKGKRSRV